MANSFATPEVGSDSIDTIEKDGNTNHNDTNNKIDPEDAVGGLIMSCRFQLKAVFLQLIVLTLER